MQNPFSNPTLLNMPLATEQCQIIHFGSVQKVLNRHPGGEEVPDSVDIVRLRNQAHICGKEVCLANPTYIEEIFHGMTTDVYRTVQDLYCDRLGRSGATVAQILTAMADQAGVNAIHTEAIWAVCSYLSDLRRKRVEVTCSATTSDWIIGVLSFEISIYNHAGAAFAPDVVCVIEKQTGHIVAFRVSQGEDIERATLLAVFDALAAQREVSAIDTGGLLWRIPQRIWGVSSAIIPQMQKTFAHLPIELQGGDSAPAITGSTWPSIQGQWYRELKQRRLTIGQFQMFFDQRLFRLQGFGPDRTKKERNLALANYRGFSRDPADVFPALRRLLPMHTTQICNGAVLLDGLHYADDLLHLWPGKLVGIRRSEEAESRAWIYFDDDVLCEANAIELRRRDGTYRPWRTGD